MVMLICGEHSIREVMAFPKNNRGQDLMSQSPSGVEAKQLRALGIKLASEPKLPQIRIMFVEGGLHPEQVKGLRAMSLQRRLDLSLQFIEQGRELRAVMLRYEHPDWSEEDVSVALRDFVRNACR